MTAMPDPAVSDIREPDAVRAADLLPPSAYEPIEFDIAHSFNHHALGLRLREPMLFAGLIARPREAEDAPGGWTRVRVGRNRKSVYVFISSAPDDGVSVELVREQTNLAAPILRIAEALEPGSVAKEGPELAEAMNLSTVGAPLKLAFRVLSAPRGSRVVGTIWMPSLKAMGEPNNWFDRAFFTVLDHMDRAMLRHRVRKIIRSIRD